MFESTHVIRGINEIHQTLSQPIQTDEGVLSSLPFKSAGSKLLNMSSNEEDLASIAQAVEAANRNAASPSYKEHRPRLLRASPRVSVDEEGQAKFIEFRGQQVAAFDSAGLQMICLPQVYELFLKSLVGGLHTVYTKLKRLNITPVICNVQQVRSLRSLGAIQPGVNRCKLIARADFDTLLEDCVSSCNRPGRPPKRHASDDWTGGTTQAKREKSNGNTDCGAAALPLYPPSLSSSHISGQPLPRIASSEDIASLLSSLQQQQNWTTAQSYTPQLLGQLLPSFTQQLLMQHMLAATAASTVSATVLPTRSMEDEVRDAEDGRVCCNETAEREDAEESPDAREDNEDEEEEEEDQQRKTIPRPSPIQGKSGSDESRSDDKLSPDSRRVDITQTEADGDATPGSNDVFEDQDCTRDSRSKECNGEEREGVERRRRGDMRNNREEMESSGQDSSRSNSKSLSPDSQPTSGRGTMQSGGSSTSGSGSRSSSSAESSMSSFSASLAKLTGMMENTMRILQQGNQRVLQSDEDWNIRELTQRERAERAEREAADQRKRANLYMRKYKRIKREAAELRGLRSSQEVNS